MVLGIRYEVNSETPYTGKYVGYYENGQKNEETNYKDGKIEGLLISWYRNGQKEYEGNFIDGKEEGLWTWWDKEGNVTKTETYKDDELVD